MLSPDKVVLFKCRKCDSLYMPVNKESCIRLKAFRLATSKKTIDLNGTPVMPCMCFFGLLKEFTSVADVIDKTDLVYINSEMARTLFL